MFELVKWKEGFETKLYALESPDSDKRVKSYTRTKIGSEITIWNNHGKSEKKKTDEQANERTFAVCEKNENRSLKRTNERVFAK